MMMTKMRNEIQFIIHLSLEKAKKEDRKSAARGIEQNDRRKMELVG